jgi:hypothetical protein
VESFKYVESKMVINKSGKEEVTEGMEVQEHFTRW